MSIQSQIDRINNNIKNAYDKIAEKQGEVPENKNSANLVNAIESIQNKSKINVYVQTKEPEEKIGIWIKTSALETEEYLETTEIPYIFKSGNAVKIGDNIYLFGSSRSDYIDNENIFYSLKAYKYNIISKQWQQLQDIPYEFYQGDAIAVNDTEIYLLGSRDPSNGTNIYKYNITTEQYTKVTDAPYAIEQDCVIYGNDIYCFGMYTNHRRVYKYSINDNSFTQMTTLMPTSFDAGRITLHNDNIFIMGNGERGLSSVFRLAYKYNITEDSYTQLTDIPYDFYKGRNYFL